MNSAFCAFLSFNHRREAEKNLFFVCHSTLPLSPLFFFAPPLSLNVGFIRLRFTGAFFSRAYRGNIISSDLRSSLLEATVDSLFHETFHPWTPSSFVPVLLSSLRFRHTYIGLGAARASFALRFFASAPLLTSQSPSPWNPPPLPIAQKT